MWNTRFYKIICWYIVDLLCFKCTAKWFWYIYICTSIHIYMYISDVYINIRKWMLSHIWLFVTAWAVACQAPLSMGFSRQEYWSGLPFPSPGDHPDPGIEFMFLASLVLAGGFLTTSVAWEAPVCVCIYILYNTYIKSEKSSDYFSSTEIFSGFYST